MGKICNVCQVENKVLDCSGLINRPQRVLSVLSLIFLSALRPTSCLSCPSEIIHYQLSWHIHSTSPLLYAKPEEMLS